MGTYYGHNTEAGIFGLNGPSFRRAARQRGKWSRFRVATAWGGVLATLLVLAPPLESAEVAGRSEPSAAAGPRYVGSLSCSASACHGAIAVPNVDAASRTEFIFWLEQDPHSRAARSLTSPQGLRMLEQLGIVREGKVVDKSGFANCQACHNPVPDTQQRLASFPGAGEGVGCESCHGPAEEWRTEHYRADRSADRLAALGMTRTKDPAVRTQVCVACHVGGRGDVNHDLIAAGHPVLKFEMAAYHAIYPKHWRYERELQANPDLEWQLWYHGQRQAARAAVALTDIRAADKSRPWPELSEWSCYACHHDLVYPSWRQERGCAGRRPGSLPMSRWYLRWVDIVVLDQPAQKEQLEQAVEELRQEWEASANPDRQRVRQIAQRLLTLLDQSPQLPPERLHVVERLSQVLSSAQPHEGRWFAEPITHDWDAAAQAYLLLRAIGPATSASDADVQTEKARAELAAIRDLLGFPSGWNSPRGYDFIEADRPGTPQVVADRMKTLVEMIQHWQGR